MANPNGNPQNFVNLNDLSPEEAFKRRSNAGKQAAKVNRAKASFRYAVEEILKAKIAYPLGEMNGFAQLDKKYVKPDGTAKLITVAERISLAMVNKAIHGDVECAKFVRDTAGQAPVKQIETHFNATGFDLNWGDVVEQIEAEQNASEMNEGVEIDGE